MALNDAYKTFDKSAKESLEWLRAEVAALRTGRVTPQTVNNIVVEHYGTRMPLQGLASVGSLDARTLQISPYDQSAIVSIEKAIIETQLGVQPVVDGKLIRLSFPTLSEEVRETTIKQLHKKAEETRIRLRQARDESISLLNAEKKQGELTEDDLYGGREELNKRIDTANKEVEEVVKTKEVEIRTL